MNSAPGKVVHLERIIEHAQPSLCASFSWENSGEKGTFYTPWTRSPCSPSAPHSWEGVPGSTLAVTGLVSIFGISHILQISSGYCNLPLPSLCFVYQIIQFEKPGQGRGILIFGIREFSRYAEIKFNMKQFYFCTININYYPIKVQGFSFGSRQAHKILTNFL